MSEIKPKRAAREPVRSEAIAEEAIAAATASVIERNMTPEPEPVSTIALAQAAPVGPACPVPVRAGTAPRDRQTAGSGGRDCLDGVRRSTVPRLPEALKRRRSR